MSVQLSAKEAAVAVNLSKAAILKAIHDGRLSANKGDGGQWCVDPVELYRVYPPVNSPVSDGIQPVDTAGFQMQIALYRELLAAREDEIAHLREQLALEQKRNMALLPGPRVNWWQRLLSGA